MPPRMTISTQLVLHVLLNARGHELYGRQITQAAGLPSGTVFPILERLEEAGWLASRWEDIDPSEASRPRRRYYQLTAGHTPTVKAALARAEQSAPNLALLHTPDTEEQQ